MRHFLYLSGLIALGGILTLSGLLLTPSTAEAHSANGHTHRHVKGSRIVRILIRKKRVGSGFAINTSDDSAGDKTQEGAVAGTVEVVEAKGAIAKITIDEPLQIPASPGKIAARIGGRLGVMIQLSPRDAKGQPVKVDPVIFTFQSIRVRDTALTDKSGWKATARLTQRGRLQAVISHDEATWASADVEIQAIRTPDEAPTPAPVRRLP